LEPDWEIYEKVQKENQELFKHLSGPNVVRFFDDPQVAGQQMNSHDIAILHIDISGVISSVLNATEGNEHESKFYGLQCWRRFVKNWREARVFLHAPQYSNLFHKEHFPSLGRSDSQKNLVKALLESYGFVQADSISERALYRTENLSILDIPNAMPLTPGISIISDKNRPRTSIVEAIRHLLDSDIKDDDGRPPFLEPWVSMQTFPVQEEATKGISQNPQSTLKENKSLNSHLQGRPSRWMFVGRADPAKGQLRGLLAFVFFLLEERQQNANFTDDHVLWYFVQFASDDPEGFVEYLLLKLIIENRETRRLRLECRLKEAMNSIGKGDLFEEISLAIRKIFLQLQSQLGENIRLHEKVQIFLNLSKELGDFASTYASFHSLLDEL